jgi:steroid 5-alpha reductase family enzyme
MTLLLLALAAAVSIAMMGGWLFQKTLRNGGWTDVVWSYVVGAAGLAGALWPVGGAVSPRQWLAGGLIAAWSLRLGTHLAFRVGRHQAEDVRYAHLRNAWGADFDRRMFGFLQIQAAAAVPLVWAVSVAARRPGDLGAADLVAVVVFAASLIGEHMADAELAAFKRDPANRGQGKICDQGLWAWSRHPNYFFEWLTWLGWPIMAVGLAQGWWWGWIALAAPIFMYLLLRYGSGVPPLEAQMARSRGEAWKAYAARTSVFFPLPPKRNAA